MEANKQRTCKKCLTKDMDQAVYFQNMHQYITNLDEEIKTEPFLYEVRLEKCKNCDFLIEAMCRGCGCFVEMRAAMKENSCPYEKW